MIRHGEDMETTGVLSSRRQSEAVVRRGRPMREALRTLRGACFIAGIALASAHGVVIYVDSSAAAGGDGASWSTAYNDLQDALADVQTGDSIWVAKGTYFPDGGTGDAYLSFDITVRCYLLGGFEGVETDASQRDWETNRTIVSGDLDDDDEWVEDSLVNIEDNSRWVVDIASMNDGPTVDGFEVAGATKAGVHIRSAGSDLVPVELRNCTVRDNFVSSNPFDSDAGGIYMECVPKVRVKNTLFLNNHGGSGITAFRGSQTGEMVLKLDSCRFSGNVSQGYGGAIEWRSYGRLTIVGSSFISNRAFEGGGVSVRMYGDPSYIHVAIENCLFVDNTAANIGGAISLQDNMISNVVNCTFSENRALEGGDIIHAGNASQVHTTNSIIWNNGPVPDSAVSIEVADVSFGFCDIQGSGGSRAWNPAFGVDSGGNIDIDPLFEGSGDHPLRLRPRSACIDRGDTATDTTGWGSDLAGNPRIMFDRIDMGSYECQTAPPSIRIYVDSAAAGADNGTSWADAYTDLGDALTASRAGDTIWVARGTYFPDAGTRDSSLAFEIGEQRYLFGGFAGGETALSQRDWKSNRTILSGDLDQNDQWSGDTLLNYGENSLKVVRISDALAGPAVDGFEVTGAVGYVAIGVYNSGNAGSPLTIANCTLRDMYGHSSSSVLHVNSQCWATLDNCVFIHNVGRQALHAYHYSVTLEVNGCEFIENSSSGWGAAINWYANGSFRLKNCSFIDNTAGTGGALFAQHYSDPQYIAVTIENCLFSGNTAETRGGALALQDNMVCSIVNSTFSGNTAAGGATAILAGSAVQLHAVNSILWDNGPDPGSAVAIEAANVSFAFSDIQGSGGSSAWDPAFGADSGGNIENDPLFEGAGEHPWAIAARSPCVNLGDPATDTTGWGSDLAGNPRIVFDRIDIGAYESQVSPRVGPIYVDSAATGGGDGGSWSTAYNDLQDALAVLQPGDSIWVAKGTYFPDGGNGDNLVSFDITVPCHVLGGFEGVETHASQRDWQVNRTILNGDLGGDDERVGDTVVNTEDNSESIFEIRSEEGCVLDGFEIAGATQFGLLISASGSDLQAVELFNLIVRDNFFTRDPGGGVEVDNPSHIRMEQVAFSNNHGAPALSVFQSDPAGRIHMELRDCSFEGNTSPVVAGGAIRWHSNGSLRIHNSTFVSNTAETGAALMALLYHMVDYIDIQVSNCLFVGNTAAVTGGAICLADNMVCEIVNSTFSNNQAIEGGDVLRAETATQVNTRNSIIWNNGPIPNNAVSIEVADVSFAFSDIQGSGGSSAWDPAFGADSGGNIDSDPLFANTGAHPYALQPGSACADTGDPDVDTTGWSLDLAGNPRIFNDRIDLGAYELQEVQAPVVPLLSTVYDNCNGTYAAHWGYHNPNPFEVEIPFGPANYMSSGGESVPDTGRPATFQPGTNRNVFALTFDGSPLCWHLQGDVDTASEALADNICPPLAILPTLDSLLLTEGDTLLVDLDRRNTDGSGYYVTYSRGDITELAWEADSMPPDVDAVLDPATHHLSVSTGGPYLPGDVFTVRVTVRDTLAPDSAAKHVRFVINGPGFDLRNTTLAQTETGVFEGSCETRRNAEPMKFSQDRMYLFDGQVAGGDYAVDSMHYLAPVPVTEVSKPLSRGGEQEWGTYAFEFNGTNIHVYNPDGTSTGKTLREWAADPVYGHTWYLEHRRLRFVLPFTNSYDGVRFKYLDIPVDFDRPLTELTVRTWTDSARVLWQSFDEELTLLSLAAIAEGDDAPPPRVIDFGPDELLRTRCTVTDLQDSRTYRFVLTAKDIYENLGESEVSGTTPSGRYAVSGTVTGNYEQSGAAILVILSSVDSAGVATVMDSLVTDTGTVYSFDDIPNGEYLVEVAAEEYHTVPVRHPVSVLRGDRDGVDFELVPDPLMEPDGMIVEQLEGSGDLRFVARTNKLFAGEEPSAVNLVWSGGMPPRPVDQELFTIDSYTVLATDPLGGATWEFVVPRGDIEAQILSRTGSFDELVRYVDAELITATPHFSTFRTGTWTYPRPAEDFAAFAPQYFRKPSTPSLSDPIMSENTATFTLYNTSPGPALTAVSRFIRKDGAGVPVDTIEQVHDVRNSSLATTTSSGDLLVWRVVDWRYAVASTATQSGARLLTGVYADTVSRAGRMSPPGATGQENSTGWLMEIPEPGSYDLWVYVNNMDARTADILLSVGEDPATARTRKLTLKDRAWFLGNYRGAGWYRVGEDVALDSGHAQVNLPTPAPTVTVGGLAVASPGAHMSGSLLNSRPAFGRANLSADVVTGGLAADTDYDLEVFLRDRFGNTGDAATLTNLRTVDNYFNGRLTLHQEAETGDLLCTIRPFPPSAATMYGEVESVVLRFDGQSRQFQVDQPLESGVPTVVRIARDSLEEKGLHELASFQRRARYVDGEFYLSRYDTITIDNSYDFAVWGGCDACSEPCDTGSGAGTCSCDTVIDFSFQPLLARIGVWHYSEFHQFVWKWPSRPFVFQWPGSTDPEVASQEYRPVTEPVLEVDTVAADRIVLGIDNLNTIPGGGAKQQLAGTLCVKWVPGSVCADSTVIEKDFGNRFTPQGDWIAFMPSFEGALGSTVGAWREPGATTPGTRHQWLDRYTHADPLQGGGFYPNVGDSVTVAELTAGPLSDFASLSMGIRLTPEQACDSAAGEEFTLWALPAADNGETSRYFYWGTDGVPVTDELGDAYHDGGTPQWIQGPSVTLGAGDHTIDLFMRDDGVTVAGIALSKTGSAPPFTAADLSRWGDTGFAIDVAAEDLADFTEHTFTVTALDRMGNVSARVRTEVTTLRSAEVIPDLVISPDATLENGFYHSLYPSFTLSLAQPYPDTLDVTVALRKHLPDTVVDLAGFAVDTAGEANVWTVTDTAGLEEYPAGAVSASSGYELLARAYQDSSSVGNWTNLFFGVRADTSEIPEAVVVTDPVFELPPHLRFRFDDGFETASGEIIGDLEVLFDFDNTRAPNQRLYLEGALIETDTAADGTHESITGISGGTFACYEFAGDVYETFASAQAAFTFPYGRFRMDVTVDSLGLLEYADGWKIAAGRARITDDRGSAVRASGSLAAAQPVPLTKLGIVDDMYCPDDYFFMENALSFSGVHPGFHIQGCITTFRRLNTGAPDETYRIVAAGECAGCGPYLCFTVASPKYLDEEFSARDKLRDTVVIEYTPDDFTYAIQFAGVNPVEHSTIEHARYAGWPLEITAYDFYASGVTLTDFAVTVDPETFPDSLNGAEATIPHFAGVKILGDANLNNGALHFFGGAHVSGAGLRLETPGGYVFGDAPLVRFAPAAGEREYLLSMPSGGSLALPSWKNTVFNEQDTLVADIDASEQGFVLGYDGIRELSAWCDFTRTVGYINDNPENPGLFLRGRIDVSYAARDFQLEIAPRDNLALFTFNSGFFDFENDRSGGVDTVQVEKSSMSLFSDFSINTFYGKREFSSPVTLTDDRLAGMGDEESGRSVTFPLDGVDIVRIDHGDTAEIRLLLLAPQFDLGGLALVSSGESQKPIYNAAFDCNKHLAGLSGRIAMPEDANSLSDVKTLKSFAENIADMSLDEIYLGYGREGRDTAVTLGAAAAIRLGKAFDNIGMYGEKILLDDLRFSYHLNEDAHPRWTLDTLHATAFPLPRRFGIGPRNLREEKPREDAGTMRRDYDEGKDYVELLSGGNGIEVSYSEESLRLGLNNWTLRLTDDFPVDSLRGLSLVLEEFEYTRGANENRGNVTRLRARSKYVPPGGELNLGVAVLQGVEIGVGCDKGSSETDSNLTNNDGYVSLHFDHVVFADTAFANAGAGDIKVYFDGNWEMTFTYTFTDTIGIIPWMSDTPDVFIDPGEDGTDITLSLSSRFGGRLSLDDGHVRSREKLSGIDTKLDVAVDKCAIAWDKQNGKFRLDTLEAGTDLDKELVNAGVVTLSLKGLDIGYHAERQTWAKRELGDAFWIVGRTEFDFKLGTECNLNVDPEIGLVYKKKDGSKFGFVWSVGDPHFHCEVAGLTFGADFKIAPDTLGFDFAYLDMDKLLRYGIVEEGTEDEEKGDSVDVGVEFRGVYWVKDDNGDWILRGPKETKLCYSTEKGFDILGMRVEGDVDISQLFTANPGIGYRDITITLNENLGGHTVPTGLSIFINGERPYIHPEHDGKLVLAVPSLKLTDNITIGDLYLEVGTETLEECDREVWYARGRGHMAIPGFADDMTVDVAFEKPHPWENVTGIRHAKVTIKLAKGSRIPLGSTPFYITGFFGALYDGSGQPEGVALCGIPPLPPGLKMEAAVFVEFESPSVAEGRLGVWIQLNRLNFGINGNVVALEGVVDAEACAALYNSGSAFHGHFDVLVEKGLAVKGEFIVDIWTDGSGGNFTSEANASVGVTRGSLIKRWWIKVPSKTRMFGGLFTRMGKFTNRKNGFTTGLRFWGKTWGLGVIGGKFKIGGMGKYKLKAPPLITRPGGGLAKRMLRPDDTRYHFLNPGLELRGNEVISIVAATDSGSYQWPEEQDSILRVRYWDYDSAAWVWDCEDTNYMWPELAGTNSAFVYFDREFNQVGRLWVNNEGRDSIQFGVPLRETDARFQYMLFAGLKPARLDSLYAEAVRGAANDTVAVRFQGTVDNFQHDMRCLVARDSLAPNGVDTLLKQRMELRLYHAIEKPSRADRDDSTEYRTGWRQIPIEQFEGYEQGHTSLVDNPEVTCADNVLDLGGLTWRTEHGMPGTARFMAAVELIDFVVEDGRGNKRILPDSALDSAVTLRENPRVLATENRDILRVHIRERGRVEKVAGLTATGSPVTSNWTGEDETRTIFVRWRRDLTPAPAGYRLSWYPSGMPELKHTRTIGPVDHCEITIPDIDSVYTAKCEDAVDTVTGRAVMCGDALDPAFYEAERFDVVLAPLTRSVFVDSVVRGPDYRRLDTLVTLLVHDSLADTIDGDDAVYLAQAAGAADRNLLTVDFFDGDMPLGGQDTVEVPLNRGRVVSALVRVPAEADTTGWPDPSDYGEMLARVAAWNGGDTLPAWLDTRMPSVGAAAGFFPLCNDTFATTVSFDPVEKDYTCEEAFAPTCAKYFYDRDMGRIDSVNACTTTCCARCSTGVDGEPEGCDPNSPRSAMPQLSPCDGNPDSLLRGRTPFGLYKVLLYALNNGRRREAVPDDGAGNASIYDSLLFKVVPPKPIIHAVEPDYVLAMRYDTLTMRVSDLWNVDSAADLRPYVRVRLKGDPTALDIIVEDVAVTENTHTTSNAEYTLRIPLALGRVVEHEDDLLLSVVNRDTAGGEAITSRSDEAVVAFVYNTDDIQCPRDWFTEDSANARFAMDWIGNFPHEPDSGDTMTVYFSELHDLDLSHYEMWFVEYQSEAPDADVVDSVNATPQVVEVSMGAIGVRLPPQIVGTSERKWALVTTLKEGGVVNCVGRAWGRDQRFSIGAPPAPRVVPTGTGFTVDLGKPRDQIDKYKIRYFIGKDPAIWPDQPSSPYPGPVTMHGCDWVTVIVTDRDGNNRHVVSEWVCADDPPQLVYTNGDTVPGQFTGFPGDTLIIVDNSPGGISRTRPRSYHCYRFGRNPEVCGRDTIVLDVHSTSPLTVENRYDDRATGTQRPGAVNAWYFELEMPRLAAPVTIPSPRLLEAASAPVTSYPLLVRIDSSVVHDWGGADTAGFHFRNSAMKPIPHDVERVDWAEGLLEVWLGMEVLDPGIGNNTVYFVPGEWPGNDPVRVWERYRSVWHCNEYDTLVDATGGARPVRGTGLFEPVDGVIGNADTVVASGGGIVLGAPALSENDPGVTLSGWVHVPALAEVPAQGMRLFSWSNSDQVEALGLGVYPDASLIMVVAGDTLRTITGVIEHGVWLHLAATFAWRNDDGVGRVYVNGLEVGSGRLNSGEAPPFDRSGTLYVGGDQGASSAGITIDEVRIAPDDLPGSWHALDYFSQRPRNDFLTGPAGVSLVQSVAPAGFRMAANAKPGDALFEGSGRWRVTADFPRKYRGLTWLKMPFDGRFSEQDTLFTVKMSGPVDVAVLLDSRYGAPPAFLDAYTPTGEKAFVEDSAASELRSLDIYRLLTDSAGTLVFGGPRSGGAAGGDLPYAVLLDPSHAKARVRVAVESGRGARVFHGAAPASLLYADREYEIDSLPASLHGNVLVRTANAFKHSSAGNFLTLSIDRRAQMSLLLDTMYRAYPDFVLDGAWREAGPKVVSGNACFSVYRKSFSPGTITLPGPRSGLARGNRAGYALLVDRDTDDCVARSVTPRGYERYCAGADTGTVLYTDSSWVITALSDTLRGAVLIRTPQADFTRDDTGVVRFELVGGAWIYAALDSRQTVLPAFMRDWERMKDAAGRGYILTSSAPGGSYTLYRNFFKPGPISFDGVRSGGETGNRFNYVFFVQPFTGLPDEPLCDSCVVIMPDEPAQPYSDRPETIQRTPELADVVIVQTVSDLDECRNVVLRLDRPARILLGIDPAWDVDNTFLMYDEWERGTMNAPFDGLLPDMHVWWKDFQPGNAVIPGIHCDRKQPGVLNYVIMIRFFDFSPLNLRATNLAVRGFGDRRSAQSAGFAVRNLDVSYAYALNLRSRSWRMNVTMRGGRALPGDTVKVLSPFIDSVVRISDTSIVDVGDTATLAELMPVLINADSVRVGAIDLTTTGAVRVTFANQSDVDVDREFTVLLFEDRDNDFDYTAWHDTPLGSAVVRGIDAHEFLVYEIPLKHDLSFPGNVIFAFVDKANAIPELDELNNVTASGTGCEEWEPAGFVSDWDWTTDTVLADMVPLDAEPVPAWIEDNNGDSVITDQDTLCLVYVSGSRVHALNTLSYDSVFSPFYINGLENTGLLVEDLDADGKPEITVGSVVYSNRGDTVWDATRRVSPPPGLPSLDFNADRMADGIALVDSCVVVYSGTDSSLLFVRPFNEWTGPQHGSTVDVLAHIAAAAPQCCDVNVSFPRYAAVAGDSAELIVRIGNAGASAVPRDLAVAVHHVAADSSLTLLGEIVTSTRLLPGHYEDVSMRAAVPPTPGTGVRYQVDARNRHFEMREYNNSVEMRFE